MIKIENSENILVFVTQLSILMWYNKITTKGNGEHRPDKTVYKFLFDIFSSLLNKNENGGCEERSLKLHFFTASFSLRCAAVVNSCRQFFASCCD